MKKTIYTLNINNYVPEITSITVPLLKYYANKINAEYYEITERKYPDWPIAYEKVQIYELAKQRGDDWSIYIDSDTIVHPETIDWTVLIDKDTVLAGVDTMFASVIFTYDKYFNRDGRNIGICNWFSIVSDWTIDYWKPLNTTPEDSIKKIHLLATQINSVTTQSDLIDDYLVSRNVAKYGLKCTTVKEVLEKQTGESLKNANFLVHIDNLPPSEKIKLLREAVVNWGLKKYIDSIIN
jgi:hypothetical protein